MFHYEYAPSSLNSLLLTILVAGHSLGISLFVYTDAWINFILILSCLLSYLGLGIAMGLMFESILNSTTSLFMFISLLFSQSKSHSILVLSLVVVSLIGTVMAVFSSLITQLMFVTGVCLPFFQSHVGTLYGVRQ